jgi:hypothetical protein
VQLEAETSWPLDGKIVSRYLARLDYSRRMKTALTLVILGALLQAGIAAPASVKGRTIREMKVIPQKVLQRSVSPKFYKSLLVSPVEGWITVRALLTGTSLSAARITRSDLSGLYDPLALQLAKEARIAGNYTLDRPNIAASVLLHLLVYQIADGTMVLSFAHLDGPGDDQADYYGCARLLVLKDNKWTEIKGPESLHGKGWAIRQSGRNNMETALKTERLSSTGAESTNYGGAGPANQ